MKEFFKTNKPIKISMIVLALFLVIIIPYALSENKGNNNKTINATEKETSKETKKETNKETKKEIVKKETNKETKKEKETSKKDDKNQKTQNNEKKSQSKTSNSNINNSNSTNYQQSSQTTQVKRTTETQTIPFNIIDNYAYTGGKSRVYQEGRSGVRTIVKEDGKVVSNTITTQPQDKIIERYVKVQSAEYKIIEKEVDDLDRPIYNEYGRARWFVHNDLTGETKYFYSAGEAEDYMTDNAILGNWGTAEDEIVVTDEIVGYETKIVKEEVKVSDEVWEWKH